MPVRGNHKLLFIAATLVGLGATFLIFRILERRLEPASVPVVVVQSNLAKGSVLEANHLGVVSWPAQAVPSGVYHQTEVVHGRMLRDPVVAGEPVLQGKLWPEGNQGELLDRIKVGMRAMTVKVNELTGISPEALLSTGVDVLLVAPDGQQQHQWVSRMVLENVRVLAVPVTGPSTLALGSAAKSGSSARLPVLNAVTLELSPADALRLDLARHVGSLTLLLRHPGDTTQMAAIRLGQSVFSGVSKEAAMAEAVPLPGHKHPPAPAHSTPAATSIPTLSGQSVEVIRGSQRGFMP